MNKLALSIDEIFHEALQRAAAAERASFLDSACDGNAALRARVEQLLAAHPLVESFLERPAPDPAPTVAPAAELPGTQIGPYKLLEQIGEGGMGLVYMAEQQRPVKRLVALKIIKPGMDSRQVIARFEAERQALAMMEHPNIARILDAGTVGERSEVRSQKSEVGSDHSNSDPLTSDLRPLTSEAGRPYFVMELVRGIPITDFCDHKRLSVCQRLELFIQVCHAVQHAHQKGIIHRDLKPTNVLVTMHDSVAVPKVIDFGIAKALKQSLTEHTLHTGFAQMVGTPLYMSPEQAEMNAFGVDTRSDVYSLGVMLYELLTGTTPFDKERLKSASFDEMRRIIREEEPETVSTRLAKTLATKPGASTGAKFSRRVHAALPELDWIVAKSLEKDRARRYESASSMARDIERYLRDEPVQACPPSALYRFRKFAKKNKTALTTTSILVASLLFGTTISLWQAFRATRATAMAQANQASAERNLTEANESRKLADKRLQEVDQERKRAQQNFDTALGGVDRMLAHVENTTKGAPPLPEATRRRILTDALLLYDQLVAQAGDSVRAKVWAGQTSGRVADLRRKIGDLKAARSAYERAVELLTEVVAAEPTIEHRDLLAWQCHGAAVFYRDVDRDPVRAGELFRRGLSIYTELLKENLTDAQRRRFEHRYAIALNNVARGIYSDATRRNEALDMWNEVLQLADRISAPLDEAKAYALHEKANHISKTSPAEADALYQEVVEHWRRRAASSSYSQFVACKLAEHLIAFAAHLESRAPEKARGLYDEAVTVRRQMVADYPAEVSFVAGLVDVLEREGNLLRHILEKAEPLSDATDGDPDDNDPVSDRPGGVGRRVQFSAEAESLLNEAASLRRQLASDDPTNPNRHSVVDFLANQARALRRSASALSRPEPQKAAEQLTEADRLFRQAIAAQRERLLDSGDANHRVLLCALLTEQATFLQEQASDAAAAAKAADAVKLSAEAIELARILVKDFPDNFDYKDRLVNVLLLHANVLHRFEPVSAAATCREAEDLLWRCYRELKARENERLDQAKHSFTAILARLVDHYASSRKGVKDEPMARELLAECQRHFGDDDGRTAQTAEWVAWCLYHKKRFCEAEPYFRQYVDWSEMHLPKWWGTSNRVSVFCSFLSGAAAELQSTSPAAANAKLAEAEELLLRTSRVLIERENDIPEDWKFCVTQSLQRLVDVYTEINKANEAGKRRDEAPARQLQVDALLTQAIQLYRGLAAEFPDKPDHKNRLAELLKLKAQHFGLIPSLKHNLDLAARLGQYDVLDELAPDHDIIARQLASLTDREQAIAELSRRIEKFPATATYYRQRGLLRKQASQHAAAVADLTKAIESDPDDADALAARASSYVAIGQFDLAMSDYNQAIELKPDSYYWYGFRGDLFKRNKEYEKAIADYTVNIDSGNRTGGGVRHIFKRRGWAHFYLGQYDKALADFEIALETDTSTLTWIPLADIAACPSTEFKEAFLRLADDVVERDPDKKGEIRLARAHLLAAFGKRERARLDVEDSLAAAAKAGRTIGATAPNGMLLLQLEMYVEAEPLLRQVVAESDKRQPDAWTTFNRQSMLGGALLGQARQLQSADPAAAAAKLAEAEPLLVSGYDGMKARESTIPDVGTPRLVEALQRLIELYTILDKPDAVAKWKQELDRTTPEQPQ